MSEDTVLQCCIFSFDCLRFSASFFYASATFYSLSAAICRRFSLASWREAAWIQASEKVKENVSSERKRNTIERDDSVIAAKTRRAGPERRRKSAAKIAQELVINVRRQETHDQKHLFLDFKKSFQFYRIQDPGHN